MNLFLVVLLLVVLYLVAKMVVCPACGAIFGCRCVGLRAEPRPCRCGCRGLCRCPPGCPCGCNRF